MDVYKNLFGDSNSKINASEIALNPLMLLSHFDTPERVPNNTNITRFITPGIYTIDSNNDAKTMSSMPTNVAGTILNIAGPNAGDDMTQVYIPYSGADIYFRKYYDYRKMWFGWYKLTGTAIEKTYN